MMKLWFSCSCFRCFLGFAAGAAEGGRTMQSDFARFCGQWRKFPRRTTCQGADRAPALAWTDVPAASKSLVLIVDDPDARPDPAAPKMTWVHWVAYNLPAFCAWSGGRRNPASRPRLDGLNDWKGNRFWRGPCSAHRPPPLFLQTVTRSMPCCRISSGRPRPQGGKGQCKGMFLARAELIGTY